MTREEAIKLLEHISIAYTPTDAYGDYDDPQPYEEAIDMAIEALHREEAEEKGYCHRIIPKNVEVVVRCKDCRYRDLFSCPLADNDFQKDEDFCSWGERREP